MDEVKKVALVTGCSSGIGLATAIELAMNGYITYASMRADNNPNVSERKSWDERKEPLEKKFLSTEGHEGKVMHIIELDVSDDESVSNAFKQIESDYGRIDVLVNNAGHGFFGSVESTKIEDFKSQFESDFYGTIRTIQKVLPFMRAQESGRIINVSSVAGFTGFPVVPAYVSCKFAIEGLTESLRHELYEADDSKRIEAILIEPGIVNTNFYKNMTMKEETIARYQKIINGLNANMGKLFSQALEPEKVAKRILHVIELKNPEPRYRVGYDADDYWDDKMSHDPLDFEKIIRRNVEEYSKPSD